MRIACLVSLLSMALAGCSSPGDAETWLVAPTRQDWEAAFAKLTSREQASVKRQAVSFAAGPLLDCSIYHLAGETRTNDLIKYDRLDLAAIVEGYNQTFGHGSANRWEIVKTLAYEQIGTPNAVQRHRFELEWTFRDPMGKTLVATATDFGPGIKIWRASHDALLAEMNQAFALTFLELVAQLEKPPSSP